jgi:hypothetical protein
LLPSVGSTIGRYAHVERLLAPRVARAEHASATRATTVVSQPPRLSTSLVSVRLSRSYASWTASSASLSDRACGM